jgi:signal transduction histidine kinase
MSETNEPRSLDSVPDAVIVVEASGRLLFLNARARTMFALGNERSPGLCLSDLIDAGFSPADSAPGELVQFEAACLRRDGVRFRADGRAAGGSDGRVVVSLRERLEAQQTTVPAKGTAEAALEQQRAFFSLFNHDVRQSLQAIQFIIESVSPSAPEAVSVINEILASVRRLLDTVLRLNETGAIVPVAEPCGLAGLLQSLRRELEPLARRKGLGLRLAETAETVCTDPVLLRELLQNLIANAIRYTHTGHVSVACRASPLAVKIEIADTGVGMSERQLARFLGSQGGVPSLPSGGRAGLGLVIVKRLADLLGLEVEAESKPGAGSSFTVTVPRRTGRMEPKRVTQAS